MGRPVCGAVGGDESVRQRVAEEEDLPPVPFCVHEEVDELEGESGTELHRVEVYLQDHERAPLREQDPPSSVHTPVLQRGRSGRLARVPVVVVGLEGRLWSEVGRSTEGFYRHPRPEWGGWRDHGGSLCPQ